MWFLLWRRLLNFSWPRIYASQVWQKLQQYIVNRANIPIYRKNLTELSLTVTEKHNHHNTTLELRPKLVETNITAFLSCIHHCFRTPPWQAIQLLWKELLTKVKKTHSNFCITEVVFDTGWKYNYYAKCLVLKEYFLLKEKSYLSQVCYMCSEITNECDPSARNCLEA